MPSAAKVLESYPWLEESGVIDVVLPKKEQIMIGKWCMLTLLMPSAYPKCVHGDPCALPALHMSCARLLE